MPTRQAFRRLPMNENRLVFVSGLVNELDALLEVLRQILFLSVGGLNVQDLRWLVVIAIENDVRHVDDAQDAFHLILDHQRGVRAIFQRAEIEMRQHQGHFTAHVRRSDTVVDLTERSERGKRTVQLYSCCFLISNV